MWYNLEQVEVVPVLVTSQEERSVAVKLQRDDGLFKKTREIGHCFNIQIICENVPWCELRNERRRRRFSRSS